MQTYRHKYKNNKAIDKELLDQLLYEDLTLLQHFDILNSETVNDLAFWAGVAPLYLIELMNIHNERVKKNAESLRSK